MTDGGQVETGADRRVVTAVERGGASTIATVDVNVDGDTLALLAAIPYGTTAAELSEALDELQAVLEDEPHLTLPAREERDQLRADGGTSTGGTEQLIEDYLDSLDDLSDVTKRSREFAVRDFLQWLEEAGRDV